MRYLISWATRFIPRHILQRVAAAALRIIGIFYLGHRYQDPISGKCYRKLLPYGRLKTRPNALAPHSLSLERHRLLWLYLQQRTNLFSAPLNMLHIAPEYCFIKRLRNLPKLHYITADLISPWADVKMDVQQIPYPDNSFDVVMCNHVLEHVQDDRQAMREIYRVLQPGGFPIMQVPIDDQLSETLENPDYNTPALREKYYGQSDHLRQYGRDYPKRLTECGFAVTEDDFVQQLDPELVARYALPPDEIIYLCKKEIS